MENWKGDFLRLWMSNDMQDFRGALELKRAHIPAKLYRYQSLATTDKLTQIMHLIDVGGLYCSRPVEFNDPFEMKSLLSSSEAGAYFGTRGTTKSVHFEALNKHFGDEEVAVAMQGDDWFEKYSRLFYQKIADENNLSFDLVSNTFNNIIMKEIEGLNAAYNSLFSMCRVACFTEKCDNLPMWHHYANNHKGICLEYDTSQINVIHINNIFPVNYTTTLPDAVQQGFQALDKEKLPFGLIVYYCIHKLLDWSYEKEWRLVFQPGMKYFSMEEIPQEYWECGMEINFTRPSKLILGSNISDDNSNEICRVAHQHNIQVSKMTVTDYGLDEKPAE